MKVSRPVGIWLLGLAFVVFVMAVIGAITRLTGSGLSIADWHTIQDILPPSTPAQWQHAFELYQATPQYRQINHGMTMAEYQTIYFWEWFHRFWGRVVLGSVLVLPGLYFAATRHLTRPMVRILLIVLVLFALQAFMGWYMVQSGLDQRPSVSHYRLAMHLGLALTIYGILLWNGLSLVFPLDLMRKEAPQARSLRRHALVGLGFVATTMVWGAFVAGLHAGLIYNTFPLMNGRIIPGEWDYYRPVIVNFAMNPATVQFTHRWLAVTTGVIVLALAWRAWTAKDLPKPAKDIATALIVAVPAQITLGIFTLLHYVPVKLAAAHQAGAITVLSLMIAFLFVLRRPHGGAMLTRVLERPEELRSGRAPSDQYMQSRNSTATDR